MKKLLILLIVLVIVFALAGCGNAYTPINYSETPPIETTADAAAWQQEAFAEILLYYYANVPLPDEWLDWHFFLHDTDKDGIPELFIVYLAAGIWSESIYTFTDGVLMPICGSFFAYWGIWPPINRYGIVINAYGRYDLMVTHNGELVTELAFMQPFFPTDEQRWHINGAEVPHDEFTEMFRSIMPVWVWDGSYIGERTNIFPHIISEANIQDIIFGQ
jgi:predicted small lipoprotein YifL